MSPALSAAPRAAISGSADPMKFGSAMVFLRIVSGESTPALLERVATLRACGANSARGINQGSVDNCQ